jgi:hypothetical protein
MPKAHREFLIGFKRGQPDWSLLGVPGAAELPVVRWKQLNFDRLAPAAEQCLEVIGTGWAIIHDLARTLRYRHSTVARKETGCDRD